MATSCGLPRHATGFRWAKPSRTMPMLTMGTVSMTFSTWLWLRGSRWSPVSRRNLGLKRRSRPAVDEVEDGGRAIVIEEGITAMLFSYAIEHNWLRGVSRVDHDVLRMVKKMTGHLEVQSCTLGEWEATVLMACPIWKAIVDRRGGQVEVDLSRRALRVVE